MGELDGESWSLFEWGGSEGHLPCRARIPQGPHLPVDYPLQTAEGENRTTVATTMAVEAKSARS